MAAFTLTATGVTANADAAIRQITSAEAHNPGQAVTAEGEVVDPNDANKLKIIGLAVSYGGTSGKTSLVISGEITVSDSLTPQRQIIAAPSGQLQYDDDLLSGDYYVVVGYTKDANTIVVHPKNAQVAKA